jgi:AcrR family transcriptional regulator
MTKAPMTKAPMTEGPVTQRPVTQSPVRPVPAGTRTLRRDAAENRERLMRAAWEVFAELGPDAGVEDIARRAGVGMGTLYRRFPTKEALIQALHDDLIEWLFTGTRQTVAAAPEGRGLEAFLWHTGAVMSSHYGCLNELWRKAQPDFTGRRHELWAMVAQLLEQARQAGQVRDDLTLTDVYLTVLSLRGLIEETVKQAPEAWRRHLSVVLAGFRPAAQPLDHRPADDSLVEAGVPLRERAG